MIIRKSERVKEEKPNLRGGPGTVEMLHLSTKPCKNCRLVADLTLPPGAGIGTHDHVNETEYYLITEGTGVVEDNGKAVQVTVGDVVETGNGASHSILNEGKVPLKFTAIIVTC
jgi:mannose-6-phosphate isomerase-like protein (cupin superfamily)